VTASTNVLIVPDLALKSMADGESASKKISKAKSQGVTIMSESEWLGRIKKSFGDDWKSGLFPFNTE
jgi:hypothetical protein